MKLVGSPSAEEYHAVGRRFVDTLCRYGKLERSHRVLDVGCGPGRLAVHLAAFLDSGSYEGFDVDARMVAWAQENIAGRHANFRFQHVDVANGFYHAGGGSSAARFRFPFPDAAFDYTLLTSVFTHMLRGDVVNYLAEVSRTLKPGGTALMTFYLHNDEARALRERARPGFGAWHRHGAGTWVLDRARPEACVGYAEQTARSMVRECGLQIHRILFGSWRGLQDTLSGQDIVIVRKPTGPAVPEPRKGALARIKAWF